MQLGDFQLNPRGADALDIDDGSGGGSATNVTYLPQVGITAVSSATATPTLDTAPVVSIAMPFKFTAIISKPIGGPIIDSTAVPMIAPTVASTVGGVTISTSTSSTTTTPSYIWLIIAAVIAIWVL